MKRSGRKNHYRPKDPRPVCLSLTPNGVRILVNAEVRTGASRSDVVEQLLRRFGTRVMFPEPKEDE